MAEPSDIITSKNKNSKNKKKIKIGTGGEEGEEKKVSYNLSFFASNDLVIPHPPFFFGRNTKRCFSK